MLQQNIKNVHNTKIFRRKKKVWAIHQTKWFPEITSLEI